MADLLKDAGEGKVTAAVVLGGDAGVDADALEPLKKLSPLVVLASNEGALTDRAGFVVPVACYAEMDGTFVNAAGVAQRFARAIPPPEGVKPAWETIVDLASLMGKEIELTKLADVRKALPNAAADANAEGSGA